MYQIIFTGTGHAFYAKPDNFQSNFLIKAPNQKLFLVDCGSDIHRALYQLGLGYRDINDVYISHLHNDHVGGLEWLAYSRYFDADCARANLYLPSELSAILWQSRLQSAINLPDSKASLDDFFKLQCCPKEQVFNWEGVQLTPIFSYHTQSHGEFIPCYGLWIETASTKIWFSSDSQFTPEYHQQRFEQADIILHDCETTPIASGVHTHYHELVSLPNEIKSKMLLYHYHDAGLFDAKQDGFKGFAQPGVEISFA